MIKEYSLFGFPFTPAEIRTVAYEFPEKNNLPGFSDAKEMAGHKWFQLFLKCHEELHVKQGATNLSLSKAFGMIKGIVDSWFDKYETLVESMGITDPACIWNTDEHGSEDMHKVKKVLGIKGIKQFQVQLREKGRHTTMMTYVNGVGYALPPMVIHRGKYHDSWWIDAPKCILVRGSKKATSTRNYLLSMGRC